MAPVVRLGSAEGAGACGVLRRATRCSRGPRGRRAPAAAASSAASASAAAAADGSPGGRGGAVRSAAEFVRPHLRELAAYTPIEPFEVLSQRLGRAPEDIVKLDANENPYGPPPEVSAALGAMAFPHIYPDPECRALRAALAEDCGVPAEHLLAGCGADEIIDLLMRVVLDVGDVIVNTPPTFGMYKFDAEVNGAAVVNVPRKPDFAIDVPGIEAAVREHGAKIVFVTSPNNPDGSVLPTEEIERLLDLPALVVLDEAYIEFGDAPSKIGWVTERENLIVLRTFSKRAALAGMRIGYGAFPLSLIEYMWRAKQPYNVSVAAETAALAALGNPQYLAEVRDLLVQERKRLFAALREVPFLDPYPSEANFVLCRVNGRDASELKQRLATEEGIMVRYYSSPAELAGCIRISVGKPEHTDRLIEAFSRM